MEREIVDRLKRGGHRGAEVRRADERSLRISATQQPLLLTCLASLFLLLSTPAVSAPPNVVLIMTDNHGAWTLGCYGNRDIRTPNIDRLASQETLFTRAFASNPVCSPTRATFLTGLVPSQHGVHSFLSGGRLQVGPDARCTLDEFTSLPEVLRAEGYACGLVGKWHLGANLHPQEGLDDYWITMPHGGTSTFYDAQVIENGEIRREPKYLTDLWTEHAVGFINSRAEQRKPFFLFLAYNGPYALSRLLLRDGRNRHADYYADKPLLSFPRVHPHPWQLNNRDFINNPTSIRRVATEVSGVDDGVGEVMSALRDNGLDEDTVVIFVADQGWVGGHGGFFGMGDHTRPLTARDGMMQIPMIWRHPKKIDAGIRSDQMIANYDFLPTLLGHLGISDRMPTSPKSPGRDFSDELTSSGEPLHDTNSDAVFYEFENLRCVRTETHKYVHRHPNGPHELYDLRIDPDEFVNLVADEEHAELRRNLESRLHAFYSEYALPKYDLWNGGTSQVRIHDGIDEEVAQLPPRPPPTTAEGFSSAPIEVPEGFTVELAAAPPLVTHPTMACFDDRGRLYVCNNAGVNMTNDQLQEAVPNSIRQLVDNDHDGVFDSYTVFADQMTFPMGGVWKDGSLYVASPPNIWRLTDTDEDGVADQREIVVSEFGYNGNAASIHGCFLGPGGRIYWTDGYHGHQFKDAQGNVTSEREGSYIFSCRSDGTDVQIHCGGGMDNPVEIDFTDSGDMLGTVNILYTRPRVDCLVHWLHGGAYPHRQRVLNEIKITGDLLGPIHRFGHVAISGVTRYRSGVLDHRWGDNLFATFFNSGKVVRLSLSEKGSTYGVTQHEFLTSSSRDFHPTDVLEDADGTLLVIDTGGWFYRGCPTSQFAKPDLLGGIYRVRRDGMTTMVDPRGTRIDWEHESPTALTRLLNDTRVEVREQAISACVRRCDEMLPTLTRMANRGDIRVRANAIRALSQLSQRPDLAADAADALRECLADPVPTVRSSACQALSWFDQTRVSWITPLLKDDHPAVRRRAATTLGILKDPTALPSLLAALDRSEIDRGEQHAIVYAMIEIDDADSLGRLIPTHRSNVHILAGAVTALDQISKDRVEYEDAVALATCEHPGPRKSGLRILSGHREWADRVVDLVAGWTATNQLAGGQDAIRQLATAFIDDQAVQELLGRWLQSERTDVRTLATEVIAVGGSTAPHRSWLAPLGEMLNDSSETVMSRAVDAVSSMQGSALVERLHDIASDPSLSVPLRSKALVALAARGGRLSPERFEQMLKLYRQAESPSIASRAASVIGSANLNNAQRLKVAPLVEDASPNSLRDFLRVFERNVDASVAEAFLDAIELADSRLSLAEHELSDVIKRFPRETLSRGNQLLDELKQHHQRKLVRLEQLRDRLHEGDPERGRQIFASEKAKCSACHRVAEQGSRVGPDLTTIGQNRSAEDLLESIVFPSASVVRDYETTRVLTTDGRVLVGVVVNESTDQLQLQKADGSTSQVRHSEIEEMAPSVVSIMPSGLDEALTETELLHVVRYLLETK